MQDDVIEGLLAELRRALELPELRLLPATGRQRHPARQVRLLSDGATRLVMKVDLDGDRTGRLIREHGHLEQFRRVFASGDRVQVIEPLWLGAGGRVLVTRLEEGRTLLDLLKDGADEAAAADAFRAAGRWLGHLHRANAAEEARFWPKWMIDKLDEVRKDDPQADAALAEKVCRKIAQSLRKVARHPARKVLSHGDFHGNNLILAGDRAIGLDLTEVTRKLAIYDILDVMRADMHLGARDLHPSGLSRLSVEAFSDGYGPLPDPEIFVPAMQARLAIDWLTVTKGRYADSAAQRARFDTLSRRLVSVLSP